MRLKDYSHFLGVLSILLLTSNCAKFINNLRPSDSDPSEAEEGLSRDEAMGEFPESDRSPASLRTQGNSDSTRSWVTPEDVASNRRNRYRTEYRSPDSRPEFKNGSRATKDDFIDQSQEEGSLWASSGQTNYYFTKNKIRSPGDIVTLVIENDLFREMGNEIKHNLSPQEKNEEVAILQDQTRRKIIGQPALPGDTVVASAAAPERAPAAATPAPAAAAPAATAPAPVGAARSGAAPLNPDEVDKIVSKIGFADVNIFPSLEFKAGEQMVGEIVERYPNGNYRFRTTKRVNYKQGAPRIVTVTGVVKSVDVAEETDLIKSGKIYGTRIEVAQ